MVHAGDSGAVSDALRRAWATLGQGAFVAALVAVGGVLSTLGDGPIDWGDVVQACAQAAGTAVVTYVYRKVRPAEQVSYNDEAL